MRGTHNYKCIKCDQEFEYFHMGSEDKIAECPHCQTKSPEHERVFTLGTGHILKGRWFKQGY